MRRFAALLAVLVLGAPDVSSASGPDWRWRQILAVPRIGARLTAITVDEKDPQRIFVGTQEGTILRSTDGGVTWRELELRPFVTADRSLGLSSPGLPRLGDDPPEEFSVIVDAFDQEVGDRIGISSVADPFPVRPPWFFAGFLVTDRYTGINVLGAVTRSRARELKPVMRISICHGGPFPILVATSRDVYGSYDDGLTYVRLFANPGPVRIDHVLCAPGSPKDVAVATGIGLFRSNDGGLTFDQDLTAWPGQRATAVAFGPAEKGDGGRLYSASGSELFGGDLDDPNGLSYIYPNDASTAPWLPIWWMATTPDGEVWLATDDGVRMSPDKGKTWTTVSRTLFGRQSAWQVEVGENEVGQKRVAVMVNVQPTSLRGKYVSGLQDSVVLASDDRGETWFPFFHGLSRRTYRQLAALPSKEGRPGGWWIVTSGGVWTTYPAHVHDVIDEKAASWARTRLKTNPSLYTVLQEMLDHLELSNEEIVALMNAHRGAALIPRIDMRFEYDDNGFARIENRNFNTGPVSLRGLRHDIDELYTKPQVYFLVQATWWLGSLLSIDELKSPTRNRLHELRRQIQFATEDAWHERTTLLMQLSEGLRDPVQVGTTKARIEALEAMMSIWLGRDFMEDPK